MGHAAHALAAPDRSRFRHRPEDTALYQAVTEHWPAFRERAEAQGGLPRFVVKEFEEFLDQQFKSISDGDDGTLPMLHIE